MSSPMLSPMRRCGPTRRHGLSASPGRSPEPSTPPGSPTPGSWTSRSSMTTPSATGSGRCSCAPASRDRPRLVPARQPVGARGVSPRRHAMTVLVVGAGPTGLALAAQLRAFGTGFRIIDRQRDQVHESRALAIQPRTLEVLTGLGIADTLVERGNPAVRLQMHTGTRTAQLPLFDIGLDDTAYPFLLFLSQAETENILATHLVRHGVTVERGIELTGLQQHPNHVTCTLGHIDGGTETADVEYVVGCDGPRSTVRHHAGIDFTGSAYPQTFVLADLAADGLEPGAAHVYLSPAGMLFFFPLGQPAPWRLLGMRPSA